MLALLPRLRFLEEIEGWGTLVALVGGEHEGHEVLVVPRDRILPGSSRPARERLRQPTPDPGGLAGTSAERKATALLESLLDETQLSAWQRTRHFQVRTVYGAVELGTLYRLAFRRHDGWRFELCVVPTAYRDLPVADIWTNLLLMLRNDPLRFFTVANWKGEGEWYRGPVPLNIGT